MKLILVVAISFFICCNPKSQQEVETLVQNVCEMDKISSLKNAVIFFGIEEDDLSEQVLRLLKGATFQKKMVEKNLQLIVVSELCLFGEALIMEHKIIGFPSILSLDGNGNSSDPLIGIVPDDHQVDQLLDFGS